MRESDEHFIHANVAAIARACAPHKFRYDFRRIRIADGVAMATNARLCIRMDHPEERGGDWPTEAQERRVWPDEEKAVGEIVLDATMLRRLLDVVEEQAQGLDIDLDCGPEVSVRLYGPGQPAEMRWRTAGGAAAALLMPMEPMEGSGITPLERPKGQNDGAQNTKDMAKGAE